MPKILVMGVYLQILAMTFSAVGLAEENSSPESPWETYSLTMGYFISTLDTSIRLGAGLGVDIDAEDSLSLDSNLNVLRLEGGRRFGRHRVDLSWFSLRRDAERTTQRDIVIENNQGDEIVIEAGTGIKSYLDLDLYKLTYSYSFIQDDRLNLAAAAGLYFAPIGVGISSQGLTDASGTQSFNAPLPLVGLGMDVAITPRWFLRYQAQAFYMEYEKFKGSLYSSTVAVEYKPWRHAGFGLGYDILRMKLEAEGEKYPEIDLKGKIGFEYAGIMIYAKLFF